MSTAVKVNGMSKQQKQPKTTRNFADVLRAQLAADPELAEIVEEARMEADEELIENKFDETAIGRFVAPPCHACKGLLPPNRRKTSVNGRETRINSKTELIISRNIKCEGCGNSWMDYEVIKHKTT